MKKYLGKSNIAVVILTGLNGNENGFNDKYVKMAKILQEKHDANIFIFSTPSGVYENGKNFLERCISKVDEVMVENEKEDYEIYCMGSSAGAWALGVYAFEFLKIKKVLMINPVLSLNYNKLLNGLKKLEAETDLIIGDNDPSRPFLFIAKSAERENLRVEVLPNVDHVFSGDENFQLFLNLPDKYFYKENYREIEKE